MHMVLCKDIKIVNHLNFEPCNVWCRCTKILKLIEWWKLDSNIMDFIMCFVSIEYVGSRCKLGHSTFLTTHLASNTHRTFPFNSRANGGTYICCCLLHIFYWTFVNIEILVYFKWMNVKFWFHTFFETNKRKNLIFLYIEHIWTIAHYYHVTYY